MAEKKGILDSILERVGIDEVPFWRTPDYMYNPSYWLGAFVSGAFIYTVITGLFLLLYYAPANSYASTQSIINNVPYGAVILFSHLYGSYIMILLVYIHMFRNFFKGAYKKPRELQWVTGTLLLTLTLGASFFGYSLVGDVLGVNALDIGDELLVGTGFPGASTLASWVFGPGGSAALSSNPLTRSLLFDRLLGWHIIMVALIGALFGFHFMLSERYGMTPSTKERAEVPAYYKKEEWMKFNAWWPRNFIYMTSLVTITWGVILFVPNFLANINGLPIVINPYPAAQPGTPQALTTQPYPPWFFLFLYKFVDFELPNGQPLSPAQVIVIMVIGLIAIMLLPFYENSKYLYIRTRKFWTWVMSMFIVSLVVLSIWGYEDPGVPAPVSQQIEYLGVPGLIIAVALLLLGRRQGNSSGMTVKPNLQRTAGPGTMIFTSVSGVMFAGTVGNILMAPSLGSLLVLIPIGFLFYTSLIRVVRTFERRPAKFESNMPSSPTTGKYPLSKKVTFLAIPAILVMNAFLTGLMMTLPSVGPQSTYAGMDLGVELMLFGMAIQLYHYLVYVK